MKVMVGLESKQVDSVERLLRSCFLCRYCLKVSHLLGTASARSVSGALPGLAGNEGISSLQGTSHLLMAARVTFKAF